MSATLVIEDHVLTVNVLFDTGALQGNYLSKDVADWLRQHGATSKDVASRICSAFNDCQLTNNLFTCHLLFNCLDTVCTLPVFQPNPINYLVSDLPTSLRTLGPIDATADGGAKNFGNGNTTLVLSPSLNALGHIEATADGGAKQERKQSKTNRTDRNTIHVLLPSRSALGPIEATADGGAKYNGKRSKTSHHDRNQARKRLKQAACAMFHGD